MMLPTLRPYLYAAAAIAWAASLWAAYGLGKDAEYAAQARENAASDRAAAAAAMAAASAIAALEVRRVEVTQHANTIIRETPVYRDADCVHPASMLHDINRARLGTDPGELPASAPND